MSRLMKIGKFVSPRSRLACCFLRGNDVVQEAFVRLWRRHHPIDTEAGRRRATETGQLGKVSEPAGAPRETGAFRTGPILRQGLR